MICWSNFWSNFWTVDLSFVLWIWFLIRLTIDLTLICLSTYDIFTYLTPFWSVEVLIGKPNFWSDELLISFWLKPKLKWKNHYPTKSNSNLNLRCAWHNFSHSLLPHSAPSWIFSQAENLASSSLQDGATKWYYFLQ